MEEAVKGMKRLKKESKMFKTAKVLNCKRFERTFVHDENGKHVSNPEEVYKRIKDHFKRHFCEESIEPLPPFTGQQKNLDKPITTEEVKQANLKLNRENIG